LRWKGALNDRIKTALIRQADKGCGNTALMWQPTPGTACTVNHCDQVFANSGAVFDQKSQRGDCSGASLLS
jgi:hypothetical protein